MDPIRSYLRRIAAFTNRSQSERDIADELKFHMDMESESIARGGLAGTAAMAEARRRFGGADRYAEELRDERGGRRLDAFIQDVHYALRLLRRAPGFAMTVIATLGLAIGANTAVFSVVNAVLITPLPIERVDEVVRVYAVNPDQTQQRFGVSHADYLDWQRNTKSFSGISLFGSTVLTLTDEGDPERITGLVVTPNFFDVLGTQPALGRLFRSNDDPAGPPSIVLSHGFWKRRFGGDSAIVGREARFGGTTRTVLGVLPQDFTLDGRQSEAVILLNPAGIPGAANHAQHLFESIARLKPGVTAEQAHADLRAVAAQLAATHSEIAGWSTNVFRHKDEMVRNSRTPLLILLGASGLVLLIGCINVANLLSVRAASRSREVGLRQSLGASRGRIVSQLLTESGVLAFLGGALGVVIALFGTRAILAMIPAGLLPRFVDGGIDPAVLVFAFAVSALTALLVGLWPALRATGPAFQSLRESGRGNIGNAHTVRVRRFLVTAEMSLALVLLVCSGLVLQSLYNIVGIDPGFRADGVSTMRLTLAGPRYSSDTAQIQFYRQFMAGLAGDAAIESAAAANTPPIAGGGIVTPIRLPGEVRSDADRRMSPVTAVTPGYFATMGMRMIRGRDVSWSDPGTFLVASEAAARVLWPGSDPIGKRVLFGTSGDGIEVIGLVSDARARGLTADAVPMLYMSYMGATSVARTMSIVVRGSADHSALLAATKAVLRRIDPALPVYNDMTVRTVVDQSIAGPRLNTVLLSIFAGLALVLAGIGIYGVVSYSVAQRLQEFGVRMALGARPGDVLRLVLREGGILIAVGIVIGTAGAIAATTLIRTWLFGVGRGDVATFAGTAFVLGAIALVATYVPARRATRVDPVLAMRGE
jgi:predicted permease